MFRRLLSQRLPKAPASRCPLCAGNLANQARELYRHGYYVAAVATARCDLESRIAAIARENQQATGKAYRLGRPVAARAVVLMNRGLLTRRQFQRVEKLTRRAGKMLHRADGVNCLRAKWVVVECERLVAVLHTNAAALPKVGC